MIHHGNTPIPEFLVSASLDEEDVFVEEIVETVRMVSNGRMRRKSPKRYVHKKILERNESFTMAHAVVEVQYHDDRMVAVVVPDRRLNNVRWFVEFEDQFECFGMRWKLMDIPELRQTAYSFGLLKQYATKANIEFITHHLRSKYGIVNITSSKVSNIPIIINYANLEAYVHFPHPCLQDKTVCILNDRSQQMRYRTGIAKNFIEWSEANIPIHAI